MKFPVLNLMNLPVGFDPDQVYLAQDSLAQDLVDVLYLLFKKIWLKGFGVI